MRPSFVSPVSPFSGGSRLTTIRRDGSPPPPTPTGTRGTSKVMTGPGSAEICVWFKPVSPPPPPPRRPPSYSLGQRRSFPAALPQENRQLWRQLLLSSNSRPSCCRCFLFLPLLPRRNADVFFFFPSCASETQSSVQICNSNAITAPPVRHWELRWSLQVFLFDFPPCISKLGTKRQHKTFSHTQLNVWPHLNGVRRSEIKREKISSARPQTHLYWVLIPTPLSPAARGHTCIP